MKIPRIVDAMNYMDDDLVSWAVEYIPAKHKSKLWRCVGIAACLCILALGVLIVTFNNNPQPDSSVTEFEMTAEVVEVLDSGQYKVIISGEDKNFANGSTVVLVPSFSYATDNFNKGFLKKGDVISVTYTDFDKTAYEITPTQIEVVKSADD
ncbi:MAG: hypothetical protein K6F44_00365 [Lachnospiraceae bacterium]|nr:hypothetical protein [Lachnospiraceae bacterium]